MGTLHLHVKHGVGLKAMDSNGKSDPYVVLTAGGLTKQTKVIKANLDPVWNETFQLPGRLQDFLDTRLHLAVWDKDTFSKDDPMGTVTAS